VSVGRPPDPEADQRIIQAAQKLLADQGFARMSIEGVAAESGVAKTTIYRRFSDKADLATAAIGGLVQLAVPTPVGNAYEDFLAQLEFNRRSIDMAFVGVLLAEEPRNPQLLATFRERVILPRLVLEDGCGRTDGRRPVERQHARADERPRRLPAVGVGVVLEPCLERRSVQQ
jgi:AcrR family transcriptional regulator